MSATASCTIHSSPARSIARWKPLTVGAGALELGGRSAALRAGTGHRAPVQRRADHRLSGLGAARFPQRPPLRLTRAGVGVASQRGSAARARRGSAFGTSRLCRCSADCPACRARCGFSSRSPPNNMALAKGVPGYGWRAATIDASRSPFLALAPCRAAGVSADADSGAVPAPVAGGSARDGRGRGCAAGGHRHAAHVRIDMAARSR